MVGLTENALGLAAKNVLGVGAGKSMKQAIQWCIDTSAPTTIHSEMIAAVMLGAPPACTNKQREKLEAQRIEHTHYMIDSGVPILYIFSRRHGYRAIDVANDTITAELAAEIARNFVSTKMRLVSYSLSGDAVVAMLFGRGGKRKWWGVSKTPAAALARGVLAMLVLEDEQGGEKIPKWPEWAE